MRRLWRQGDIETLIAALRYEDKVPETNGRVLDLGVGVRSEAAEALCQVDDQRAVQAVAMAALVDDDERVRHAAVSGLLRLLETFRGPAPSPPATEKADQGSDPVPQAAEERAIVATQLARTLLLVGEEQLILDQRELLLSFLTTESDPDLGAVMVQEMLEALADPQPPVVERAIELIVRYARGPDQIDALILALRDPARSASAARALGQLKENRALGALVAASQSADPGVRQACIWALGEMADSRAVAAIFAATTDENSEVREEAIRGLDNLGTIAVIGGVASMLSPLRSELIGGQPVTERRRHLTTSAGSEREKRDTPSETKPVKSSDGTVLHAELFGHEQAGTIVLAHGWASSLRFWTHQIRGLAETFRVVAYDLRGHGRSQAAQGADYSFDRFGDDLEAVLRAFVEEGTPALVAGHSLGAISIAAWARRYDVEPRVKAAALLHPGLGNPVAERLLTRLTLPNGTPGMVQEPSLVQESMIRYLVFGNPASADAVSFYQEMLRECPADVRRQSAEGIDEQGLREGLARLTVPTLVIAGEVDQLAPPSDARTIAEMLPNLVALSELPGVGHMGPLEQAYQINHQLRQLAIGAIDSPAE